MKITLMATVAVAFSAIGMATVLAAEPFVPMETQACLASQKPYTAQEEFALFRQEVSRAPAHMGNATRIYYGPKLDQYGDLRLPPGHGPFPVAIVVHGGSWQAVVNSDYMAPVADLLTKNGIATWNIEYSRLGSGGEWPHSFKSVGAAADALRMLATTYPLDLKRVIAVGHSSGGHYALWLGARTKIPATSELFTSAPLKLLGVISLDGTPDIKAFGQLKRGETVIPTLLGGVSQPELEQRFSVASPAEMIPLGVPQFFVAEGSDRLPSMLDYVNKSREKGDDVSYSVLCPGHHFTTADTEDPRVPPLILSAAKKFLQ